MADYAYTLYPGDTVTLTIAGTPADPAQADPGADLPAASDPAPDATASVVPVDSVPSVGAG